MDNLKTDIRPPSGDRLHSYRRPCKGVCLSVNPWPEYERLKQALPRMAPEAYDAAIKSILEDLDL